MNIHSTTETMKKPKYQAYYMDGKVGISILVGIKENFSKSEKKTSSTQNSKFK